MSKNNYYILLDLSPEEHDSTAITAAIDRKQREWTKLRTHPLHSTWANQQLALLKEIRTKMSHEPTRKQLANEAKVIIQLKNKEKFQDLDAAIGVLSSKGYITTEEINKLHRKSLFKTLSLAEIKKRIKVKITTVSNKKKTTVSPIDKSLEKLINKNLSIIQKNDLYDFIGLFRTSSLKSLQKRIAEKDQLNKKIAIKSAEVTATGELLGHCMKIFKEEKSRASYNRTIELQKYSGLDKLIEFAGLDGIIQSDEYDYILKEAGKMGLDLGGVEDYIRQLCKQKKWAFQGIPTKVSQLLDCGICGLINESKAVSCQQCGSPLHLKCPKCKTLNRSTFKVCNHCSYPIGDMPNALPLIAAARLALASGDYSKATRLFNQADNYWKNHEQILSGKKEIKEKRSRLLAAQKELEKLIIKQYYYKARHALVALKNIDANNITIKTTEHKIVAQINKAEEYIKTAKAASSNNRKEQLLSKALDLCKDCHEAETLLKALPPDSPTGFQVSYEKNVIKLNWNKVNSFRPIFYRVLRKIESQPKHANDGEVLSESATLFYSDKSNESGESYYYAIYAIKDGTPSLMPALSDLVTRVAAIEQLKVIPSNGCITLQYKAPKKALRVEVWAKRNVVPKSRGDGILLKSVSLKRAVHNGLANNITFGYLILPVFKAKNGQEVFANGVKTLASPFSLPQPIAKLDIRKEGKRIHINWKPINGSVELYYAEQEFSFSYGQSVPLHQIKTGATNISIQQRGRAMFTPRADKDLFILPVSVRQGTAVIGRMVLINNLPEVSNITTQKDEEGEVWLQWQFPEGITQVLVTYYPIANPNNVYTKKIKQGNYEINTGVLLNKVDSNWDNMKVQIQCIRKEADELKYSSGKEIVVNMKKPLIRFQINKKKGWKAFLSEETFELEFSTKEKVDFPLLLVINEKRKITSFDDRDRLTVMEITASLIKIGTNKFSFNYSPSDTKTKRVYFSLVPKKVAHFEKVDIIKNGKEIGL